MRPRSQRRHSADVRVCPDPVFIVGAPRSGTTGLARALARHTELWTSDETLILYALFKEERLEEEFARWFDRPNASWLRAQDVDRDEFLSHIGLGINALFTNRSEGKRWVDHTPHYALMIDTLMAMFPGAYFVHMLRDGRSVVHSMVNVAGRVDPDDKAKMAAGGFLPAWTRDFRQACKTWRDSVQAAMSGCERSPQRCITVNYERLMSDPAAGFRELFQFIQVPFEKTPAEFWRAKPVNSSFRGAPDAPASAAARWHTWSPQRREIFRTEAASTMVEYGLASKNDFTDDDATAGTSASQAKGAPSHTGAPSR